jgi:hypothetical protein
MTTNKSKPSSYNAVTPSAIAYDIQVMAAYIAERGRA